MCEACECEDSYMSKKKLKKNANDMTDEELLRELFPKKAIKMLKEIALKARKKNKK